MSREEAKRRAEEDARIEALAALLGEHDRDHSLWHYRGIVHRLNAYKRDGRVTELLQAPAPRIHRDLQQQQTNSYSDEDSVLERLHELEAEKGLLYGYLRAMGSPYAAEYDPDVVAEDREDARAREERQDEAARTEAPRVGVR